MDREWLSGLPGERHLGINLNHNLSAVDLHCVQTMSHMCTEVATHQQMSTPISRIGIPIINPRCPSCDPCMSHSQFCNHWWLEGVYDPRVSASVECCAACWSGCQGWFTVAWWVNLLRSLHSPFHVWWSLWWERWQQKNEVDVRDVGGVVELNEWV